MDSAASMMYMQVYTPAPPIPDAGPGLQSVIDRVLDKEAANRYETAGEFATALGKACSTEASTRPMQRKLTIPHWVIAAGIALPIIALAVILGLKSAPNRGVALQVQTEQASAATSSAEPKPTLEPGTFPTVLSEPTAIPTLESDPRAMLDLENPDFYDSFDGNNLIILVDVDIEKFPANLDNPPISHHLFHLFIHGGCLGRYLGMACNGNKKQDRFNT